MLLRPFTFHSPKSLSEAAEIYAAQPEAKILAGGTFLLNSLKLLKRKGGKTPAHVISLRKVPELKKLELKNGQLIIGAMTIVNDLFDSPLLKDNLAVLKTVCRNISTNPIRNMATIGGNLTCRYTWTEIGAVTIALGAHMHFAGANGASESIPAETFFKNSARTDKILSHVTVAHDTAAAVAYRRVKKTMHVDVPLLAVCLKTSLSNGKFRDTRIAVNNGVSFAQRDLKLEEFLNGKDCRPGIGTEALDHIDTVIYDNRNDDYKKHMFRVSLKSAIEEIAARG